MNLLLDTHVWLWLQVSPSRLGPRALGLVADPRSTLLLSAASSWELAIKHALGRIRLPAPPSQYVPDRMRSSGVRGLAVEHAHALVVAELPPHHRDPFDRMLIAQARLEKLTLVTADREFEPYGIPIEWAG